MTHIERVNGNTIDKVVGEDENVLQYVWPFRALLEHAARSLAAYEKCAVALDIFLYGLLPLLWSDLVDRFDLLELLIGQVACSYCSIPWYLLVSA